MCIEEFHVKMLLWFSQVYVYLRILMLLLPMEQCAYNEAPKCKETKSTGELRVMKGLNSL